MKHAAAAAVNLLTLFVGISIGLLLAHYEPGRAFAQPTPQQFEEITPGLTSGTAAFGTLLAGRIAADEMTVRGIDLVKLHENTLGLLASKHSLFTQLEVQGVIEKSKATKPLRMKDKK
jgi:hypothetical protein